MVDVEAEQGCEVGIAKEFVRVGGRRSCSRLRHAARLLNELLLVNVAQGKQQLRLAVQSRADAVQGGGQVLAHVGAVRAAA